MDRFEDLGAAAYQDAVGPSFHATPDVVCADADEWHEIHQDVLWAMWSAVRDKAAEMGYSVLDACDYGAFVDFCHDHSTGRKPRY